MDGIGKERGRRDGCGGGRGWEGKKEGKEGRGARREAHGAGEGRWRGARREAHGWGRGWGGKMGERDGRRTGGDGAGEGRWRGARTGGTWVETGLPREDGGERDGRRMGGDGAGEGRWRLVVSVHLKNRPHTIPNLPGLQGCPFSS